MSAPTVERITPALVLSPGALEHVWLAARRQGVGASEVGAVVGVSPYEGPMRVWLRKVAGVETSDNPAMRWGRRFEDDVLEEFVAEHPEMDVTAKPGLFAHGRAPWRLVTPDAIGEDAEGLSYVEIKTGMTYGDAEQWGEPGTDEVPLPYLCQVTWGCDILGYDRWHLAVLLLDRRDYREYRGEFDPELAERLRERVDAFWHGNVVAGVEPTADGLPDTTDLLSSRYSATDRDAAVDLPAEARQWLTSYRVNHQALDEREGAKREAGNLLRQFLAANDAAVGTLDGEAVVTWRKPKTGEKAPSLRVKGVSW
jgi:putative phage-type endonuclease